MSQSDPFWTRIAVAGVFLLARYDGVMSEPRAVLGAVPGVELGAVPGVELREMEPGRAASESSRLPDRRLIWPRRAGSPAYGSCGLGHGPAIETPPGVPMMLLGDAPTAQHPDRSGSAAAAWAGQRQR